MEQMTHKAKHAVKRVARHKKVRFGVVGVFNTVVDFALLNILADLLGLPLVIANIASTTVAMFVSFGLNKKAVFHSEGSTAKQFLLFMTVTLGGLWLVQTTVLAVVHGLLINQGFNNFSALNMGKLVGIAFGLVWNYLWYSRVVFKGAQS